MKQGRPLRGLRVLLALLFAMSLSGSAIGSAMAQGVPENPGNEFVPDGTSLLDDAATPSADGIDDSTADGGDTGADDSTADSGDTGADDSTADGGDTGADDSTADGGDTGADDSTADGGDTGADDSTADGGDTGADNSTADGGDTGADDSTAGGDLGAEGFDPDDNKLYGPDGVDLYVPDGVTLNDMTWLSADLSEVENCTAGSPRFSIALDANDNQVIDTTEYMYVYVYQPGGSCTPTISTGDLVHSGNTWWDAGHFGVTPQTTTYSNVAAAIGNFKVLRILFVAETGSLIANSLNVQFSDPNPVPIYSTLTVSTTFQAGGAPITVDPCYVATNSSTSEVTAESCGTSVLFEDLLPGDYVVHQTSGPDYYDTPDTTVTVRGGYDEVVSVEGQLASQVTLTVSSDNPAVADTLPDGSSWSISQGGTEVASGGFDSAALPASVVVPGFLVYGNYDVAVNGEPVFAAYTGSDTTDTSDDTFAVELSSQVGTVQLNVSSSDPGLTSELPADASWVISQDGGDIISGTFDTSALPATVNVPGALLPGVYDLTVNAEPVFATYTASFEVNESSEVVDVVLNSVASAVTIAVDSSDPDAASSLPDTASWSISQGGTDVASGSFDSLELPASVNVPGYLLPGDYDLTVNGNPNFAIFSGAYTVDEQSETFAVVLDPVFVSVLITVTSSDPAVANTLPESATWTINRGDGVEMATGSFNSLDLPTTVGVETDLPLGEYELTVDAGLSFTSDLVLFEITDGSAPVEVGITLNPTEQADTVSIFIPSPDPSKTIILPDGSTLTIESGGGASGAEVSGAETLTYDISGLQLPGTVEVAPLPYGEYLLTVDGGAAFQPFSLVIEIGSPDEVIEAKIRFDPKYTTGPLPPNPNAGNNQSEDGGNGNNAGNGGSGGGDGTGGNGNGTGNGSNGNGSGGGVNQLPSTGTGSDMGSDGSLAMLLQVLAAALVLGVLGAKVLRTRTR